MTIDFKTSIQKVLGLTRTQRLMEATQEIQNNLLRGQKKPTPAREPFSQSRYGKVPRPLSQVVLTLQKIKHLGKVGRLGYQVQPDKRKRLPCPGDHGEVFDARRDSN